MPVTRLMQAAVAVAAVMASVSCSATASSPATPTAGAPATTTASTQATTTASTPATTTASTPATPMAGIPATPSAASRVPRPDHIVLVMLENKNDTSISGNLSAPYLNSLAAVGANFSQSFAITHPSQPNYIAILSGSTHGITDDSCPHTIVGENLANQLNTTGFSFKGYSESMPSDGYTGCSSGNYARKHNGWVNFTNVPASSNVRFSTFPTNFASLPTFSYVVPNLCNDMHDCSISTGDAWMRSHLDPYAQWARTHNSILIVTFDEDGGTSTNRIFTIFVGQHVKVGTFSEPINHYSILRTVEGAYGLPALGGAVGKSPITDIWV